MIAISRLILQVKQECRFRVTIIIFLNLEENDAMNIRVKTLVRSVLAASLISSIAASSVFAEEFYKLVDKNGNVSYTSVKPDSEKGVEVIPVFPAPSEDAILAAQEELQEVQRELDQKQEKTLSAKDSAGQGTIQTIESGEEVKKAPPLPASNPFIGLAPFL